MPKRNETETRVLDDWEMQKGEGEEKRKGEEKPLENNSTELGEVSAHRLPSPVSMPS